MRIMKCYNANEITELLNTVRSETQSRLEARKKLEQSIGELNEIIELTKMDTELISSIKKLEKEFVAKNKELKELLERKEEMMYL